MRNSHKAKSYQGHVRPGNRYVKDGITIDVDAVHSGEVYVRRWPKGVINQPFFSNLIRLPIEEFLKEIEGAAVVDSK